MTKKKRSNVKESDKWTPMFFVRSDRENRCSLCDQEMKVGDFVFYFPTFQGSLFCSNCYKEIVNRLMLVKMI